MKHLMIRVTDNDIAQGLPDNPCNCPVALAVARLVGKNDVFDQSVLIGIDKIVVGGVVVCTEMPHTTIEFMTWFDAPDRRKVTTPAHRNRRLQLCSPDCGRARIPIQPDQPQRACRRALRRRAMSRPKIDLAHILALFEKQTPAEVKCSVECTHLQAEHVAFDLGLASGERGRPEHQCPFPYTPTNTDLRDAWLAGHSAGFCTYRASLNESR